MEDYVQSFRRRHRSLWVCGRRLVHGWLMPGCLAVDAIFWLVPPARRVVGALALRCLGIDRRVAVAGPGRRLRPPPLGGRGVASPRATGVFAEREPAFGASPPPAAAERPLDVAPAAGWPPAGPAA